MELGLKNKKVLIMGGSAGLGRGAAEVFVEEGSEVTICARNTEKLKIAQQEMKSHHFITCDLSKKEAGKDLCKHAFEKMGGVDVLVVNVGGPPKGTFEEVSTKQWEESFQALWLAATESIQYCLPYMKKNKWGRIVLITSISAKEPLPSLTISNGLRAGLLGLSRSLSHEIAQDGITVNCVLPGYTKTQRLEDLGVDFDKISQTIPAQRLGTTKEFGSLIAYLSSDIAGYITGQTISADGGYMRGI